ncbi:hypothetical protein K9K77_02050 [Candidatus Babeliales bacterium]|nr:hypothetical protein [Candidatus Babeliales bacterium]
MKKVLVLAVIFVIFDRCMNYKIGLTRRNARIAYLKHQKEIKKNFEEKQYLARNKIPETQFSGIKS